MPRPSFRVLGIAPYEGMKTAMERTVEDYPSIHLDVYTGDLEEGAAIVSKSPLNMYDCIISRGGTAEMIRTITEIPVVEIQLSVYDVLRAIKLAENYSNRYAIVGFPSITESAHTLCDLLRYNLDIITIHDTQEVYATLTNLKQNGYRMVVSDMITHTVARELGLDAFLITSGLESLHGAFDQAILLSTNFRRLREENLFLRNIIQGEGSGVTVLDESGQVHFSAPSNTPPGLLAKMDNHIFEIPANDTLKYFYNEADAFYKVTGKIVMLGDSKYYLFHYAWAQIPLRSSKNGLRLLSKSECEYLFTTSFHSISGAMGELNAAISSIASTRQPVMIIGEDGTGKEQIARALYLRSAFSNKPFVVINCEVIVDKVWDFIMNHYNSPLGDSGCTIYFHRIEAMPEVRGIELIALIQDTGLMRRQRLLFSCNCEDDAALPELCSRFVTRLGCIPLRLPSLRSRSDEISSLASLYLESLNLELGKQISGFDPQAIKQLSRFGWPNNYTQFKRVINELAATASSSYIRSSAVAEVLHKERALVRSHHLRELPQAAKTLEEITKEAIQDALSENNGNQAAAARQLNISRSTLWRHLK